LSDGVAQEKHRAIDEFWKTHNIPAGEKGARSRY
jgi:hypothetical protein